MLFVLILYIPVNNVSVMSGRGFLGCTSTKHVVLPVRRLSHDKGAQWLSA